MKKSGLADSPLFSTPPSADIPTTPQLVKNNPVKKKKRLKTQSPVKETSLPPTNRDTMQPLNHETMTPRYHDTIIELVRKAVKEFGKEAATHRFTLDEKRAIADIIYTYKNQGVRTSENEITRIAVDFLVQDYLGNCENSILDRVLKALHD